MDLPRPGLGIARPGDRGAHLGGHDLGEIFVAVVVDVEDALHQRDAVLDRGVGPAVEGGAGGKDRAVRVLFIAHGDLADDLLGCGVLDADPRGRDRVDPLAVYVEFQHVGGDHGGLLGDRFRYVREKLTVKTGDR